MHKLNDKVDIIIPVYNNLHLTIACIKSIYKNIQHTINQVIIHDDCSSQETNIGLNKINNNNYPGLKVIRSEQNIGFAAGVNKACSDATAPYLFILNSDTDIQADIISPMLAILEHNPKIAAVNPSGPVYSAKKLRRCHKIRTTSECPGYIPSTNASGYALLIKKEIFDDIGGFNTIYGRGYYEDTEMSRVLLNKGYKLAIYETDKINHIGQASFNNPKNHGNNQNKPKSNFAKELIAKNKALYLERYPKAQETLDIYTMKSDFNQLALELRQRIKAITQEGGIVTVYGLFEPKNLPYFQIKFKKLKLSELIRFLYKRKSHKNKKIVAY
jgi:GT2 family glycosyltransferase